MFQLLENTTTKCCCYAAFIMGIEDVVMCCSFVRLSITYELLSQEQKVAESLNLALMFVMAHVTSEAVFKL